MHTSTSTSTFACVRKIESFKLWIWNLKLFQNHGIIRQRYFLKFIFIFKLLLKIQNQPKSVFVCVCAYRNKQETRQHTEINREAKQSELWIKRRNTSKNFYINALKQWKCAVKCREKKGRNKKNGQRNGKTGPRGSFIRPFSPTHYHKFVYMNANNNNKKKLVCEWVVLFSCRFGVSSSRSFHDFVRYFFRRRCCCFFFQLNLINFFVCCSL